MSTFIHRHQLARQAVAAIRALAPGPEERETEAVRQAQQHLAKLATTEGLFPTPHFPLKRRQYSGFYRLDEQPDHGYALYLALHEPGDPFLNPRPHTHASWALIAGVRGSETNALYRRADDDATPLRGRLASAGQVDVAPGTVLHMVRGDYHTVAYAGTTQDVTLHLYGIGLDSPQGLKAPSFRATDSDTYDVDARSKAYWGVPLIAQHELEAALAAGHRLDLVRIDADAATWTALAARVDATPAWSAQLRLHEVPEQLDPAQVDAEAAPVVLLGTAPAVEYAAEALARRGLAGAVRLDPTELAGAPA